MAEAGTWPQSSLGAHRHYAGSASQHSGSSYYQPPVFSSSVPSYTLTHTFTFPSYISHTHTQSQSQRQSQSQTHSTSLLPSAPHSSSYLSAYDSPTRSAVSTASPTAASIHAPVPTRPPISAASPSQQPSPSSSLSSPSSLPAAPAYTPSSSDSSSSSPTVSRSRLTAGERKARRAAKHRAIDLTRRTRELAALSQLKQLLTPSASASTDGGDSGSSSALDAAPVTPLAPPPNSSAATDSKAAVLEQTVAEVTRLRAVVASQQAVLRGHAAPLQRSVHPPLPHAMSPEWPAIYNHHITQHAPPPNASSAIASPSSSNAPSAAASTLTSLSSDLHTLYSSFFLHSPYHLTLIQPGTAAVIDASNTFLHHAMLPRHSVVGKRITLCPAVRLLLDRGDHIANDEFMGGRAEDIGRDTQASNGLSLVQLYSGTADTVLCVFRYVLGNGRVVDARGRCWLTKGKFSGVVGDAPLMIVQHGDDDYSNVAG